MPYTPPSQQSPASSKSASPAISRSSSYSEDVPRSPVTGRPQPPRSSSASYLRKHRRSPSLTGSATGAAPPTPTADAPATSIEAVDFARNISVRQSPPPVNNLRIPTGMVISPPDSSENSDGDDASHDQRGRELESNWDQLKEAVRAIDQKREGSPETARGPVQQTVSEPVSQIVSPSALTPEARKIAHSRSTTETSIILPRTPSFESPTHTSDDSDDEQGPLSKPALVRKKSGELVKPALRASSRRRYSSMPGTPTYSKSVHFNDSDNQTRHFLQVDKPMAVSAGSSPVETYESESEFPLNADSDTEGKAEREIKLSNFPADTFERRMKPVRVERIFLSPDKQILIGVCAVQNIAFHKLVVARFTLDYWKTTSEVIAEYNNDPRSPPTDGCDRFNFHIKLSDQANIDNKTLLLCVRYQVNGQEYWDNNDNTNYQIDFIKTVKQPATKPSVALSSLGARPVSAIPRSRHSPSSTSRARQQSADDDFAVSLDNGMSYHFGAGENLIGESPSFKLKPRSKRGPAFTAAPVATNGLGGRYDFGASLSAALSTAQDKLGRHSGLMPQAGPKSEDTESGYFGPLDRKEGPVKAQERPDALTTDRPAMGSDQYRDLVQKFCYFTPNAGKAPGSPQPATVSITPSVKIATVNYPTPSTTASTFATGSHSHTPSALYDGSTDRVAAQDMSSFIARSASPPAMSKHGYNNHESAISFGYPYHRSSRDGYLSDSHTPTAIQG